MSSLPKRTPSVSVLMSVYNGERYLSRAIESILAQSFTDFEFIIINDGSTDGSAEIIKSCSDSRIRYVEQKNVGLSESLITGINLCLGKYIARMDADDIALQQRLERQFDFLERRPNCALLGTACYVIKEDESIWFTMQHPSNDLEIRWRLLFNSPFVHSSVMFRRDALLEVGSYTQDESYSYVEDYELWSRLTQRYQVANLPEALLKYRSNLDGISYSKRDAQEQQSIFVSAQNLSRLLGRKINSETAEKVRLLFTGNVTCWRFGEEAIGESLDLFQEIYTTFVKRNWKEYKRTRLSRQILLADLIQTRFYAVSLYVINGQFFIALRILIGIICKYPQNILTIRFWKIVLLAIRKFTRNVRRRTDQ
jgi:glycosyltransferase involved in cell wall biosynthesis